MKVDAQEIEQLLETVRHEYLHRMTQGHGRLLRQVEQYAVARNGKMLRPRLLLLAAASVSPDRLHEQRTLLLATAMEMLHNASLLHDDVIDHADRRRGRASVNAQWSNSIAVLVGDYHLARIMELLDDVGDADASRMVNQTVMAMVEAELLQQEHLASRAMTEDDYITVVDGKTANLFATAAALGNSDWKNAGLNYGRLFQICDDIRDKEAPPFAQQLANTIDTQWPDGFDNMPNPRMITQ